MADFCPKYGGLKSLLIISIASVLSQQVTGTTIIALVTGSEAILGLDSRQVMKQGDRVVADLRMCKIATRGNGAYGIAGLSEIKGRYNALQTIQSNVTDDFPVSLSRLRQALLVELRREIPKVRKTDLAAYIGRDESIFSVFAIGLEKRKPALHLIYFFINGDLSIRSEQIVQPTPGHAYFEVADEITQRISTDWFLHPLAPLLRELMRIGIVADPVWSGGPISMIRVTTKGTEWIEVGACKTSPAQLPTK
jgi:hypothetical protein